MCAYISFKNSRVVRLGYHLVGVLPGRKVDSINLGEFPCVVFQGKRIFLWCRRGFRAKTVFDGQLLGRGLHNDQRATARMADRPAGPHGPQGPHGLPGPHEPHNGARGGARVAHARQPTLAQRDPRPTRSNPAGSPGSYICQISFPSLYHFVPQYTLLV